MINGYCDADSFVDAFLLLKKMRKRGRKTNVVTLNGLIYMFIKAIKLLESEEIYMEICVEPVYPKLSPTTQWFIYTAGSTIKMLNSCGVYGIRWIQSKFYHFDHSHQWIFQGHEG